MKTLKDAKVGDTVIVAKLHGEGAVKRRIMDMGITKGVEIHIRKVAPLGDPMELNVRGYELSVRKADAVSYTHLLRLQLDQQLAAKILVQHAHEQSDREKEHRNAHQKGVAEDFRCHGCSSLLDGSDSAL